MKYLLSIIVTLFMIGCSVPSEPLILSEWNIELDGRLDTTIDGYYTLPINMGSFQTLHRVSGQLTQDGISPEFREKITWESSHYWVLSDTLGFIVRRTIDAFGNWSVLDTSYVIGFDGVEVPTINPASYTKDNGEVNQMIAPIRPMKGDTMTVRAVILKNNIEYDNVIRIILQ